MKNYISLILLFTLFLTGCRAVQPVLFLSPADLIWMPVVYIVLSYGLAKFLYDSEKKNFAIWFAGCLILSPVFGIIVILYRLSQSGNKD